MDDSNFIFPLLIGLIVWLVIIYSIIENASRSKKIERQLRMQTLFLAKMAQKAGVSDQEVNDILNIK